MAIGPGKYDDVCTIAQQATGGNVLLIVVNGNKGNGFSCQADLKTTLLLPEMLEYVARRLRKDGILLQTNEEKGKDDGKPDQCS